MIKHSKQRDLIYDFMMGRTDHPSAETVYRNIREELPNISLGTVYRNLSLLADLGMLQKISIMNGPDRFDAALEPHNHFLCDQCNCVMDLTMDDIDFVDEMAGKHFKGKITGHSVLFHGICPDCMSSVTTS